MQVVFRAWVCEGPGAVDEAYVGCHTHAEDPVEQSDQPTVPLIAAVAVVETEAGVKEQAT